MEMVHINSLPAWRAGDMQMLDPMYVSQSKGKPLSLLWRNKLIHIDRMNRLLTFIIATTVAKGLPASGKAGEKDVGHASHPHIILRVSATRLQVSSALFPSVVNGP
jgi:hypothetical protein